MRICFVCMACSWSHPVLVLGLLTLLHLPKGLFSFVIQSFSFHSLLKLWQPPSSYLRPSSWIIHTIVLPPHLTSREYLESIADWVSKIKQYSPNCPVTADVPNCALAVIFYFVFRRIRGVWLFHFLFHLFCVAVMWHDWFFSLPWQHLLGSQHPPSVQLWVSFGRKPMRAAQFVTRHPINVSGVRLGVGRGVSVPIAEVKKRVLWDCPGWIFDYIPWSPFPDRSLEREPLCFGHLGLFFSLIIVWSRTEWEP